MPRDDASLLDVLQASRRAEEFLGGLDLDAFLADVKTQSAVLHQLLVLGEAVKRLSPTFRESHPEIPWKEIAGSRDILIHAYDSVDLGGVWRAVTEDVPKLVASVAPLVSRPEGRSNKATP